MTEIAASITALLSTPVSSSLGEARKELLDSSLPQVNVSLQEFARELRHAVNVGDSETAHNLLRNLRYCLSDLISEPPLICVAASKGYGDIVGLLIRHGADINAFSIDGSTALICAADSGHFNVLALLLNAGAQMNLLNRNGETALARATRRGWVNCARLLLTYGANPHPMATDGHSLVVSPLHLARQMYQPTIEQDIMSRAMSMEKQMLEIVRATLPKHVCLLEPGHLVDTRTSSFFPLQLISDKELEHFVLYFKTPPGFDRVDGESVNIGRRENRGPSDELILIYIVRVHLSDGQPTCWVSGPGFSTISLSFNGTKRNSTRLPISFDHPGLCVFSVSTAIKPGGLNTVCFETPIDQSSLKHLDSLESPVSSYCSNLMNLIGAYRVRIDVTSLIQASAGLNLGTGSSKATIYIPRSIN